MTTPDFVDLPEDGRSKYPALLADIRKHTRRNPNKWAILVTFTKVGSARDTARRLRHVHPEFEYTTRTNDDGISGTVYARLIKETR